MMRCLKLRCPVTDVAMETKYYSQQIHNFCWLQTKLDVLKILI
jgi:hypothetical protein